MSELIDRSARVSTLELFFDLVFVFTITQLTAVLVNGDGAASAVQVVVMLALIWWMYDGYAWLTNAIATDLLRFRLLLLGGMGGFLVVALAIPNAYVGQGLAFGIGYAIVVILHAGMYVKRDNGVGGHCDPPARPVQSHRRSARARRGRRRRWACRTRCGLERHSSSGSRPWFTSTEGFVIAAEHFCERHGLVIIVALGESIVVIGAGAVGVPLDLRLALVALLALGLSASLWWMYFRDEDGVEHAHGFGRRSAAPTARADCLRLLALRTSPRRRRDCGRNEEGRG